jgi:hypothetical protein
MVIKSGWTVTNSEHTVTGVVRWGNHEDRIDNKYSFIYVYIFI